MDYSVLYCALLYRNKKTKSWQEGFIKHHRDRRKIDLYDTHHSLIDSAFVKAAVCIGVGLELELDRHLVTVESEMANGSTVCGSEESTRHTVVTGKPQLHTTARIASISGSTIGSTTRLTASTSVAAALRPQQQRRIGLKATKKGPPLVQLRPISQPLQPQELYPTEKHMSDGAHPTNSISAGLPPSGIPYQQHTSSNRCSPTKSVRIGFLEEQQQPQPRPAESIWQMFCEPEDHYVDSSVHPSALEPQECSLVASTETYNSMLHSTDKAADYQISGYNPARNSLLPDPLDGSELNLSSAKIKHRSTQELMSMFANPEPMDDGGGPLLHNLPDNNDHALIGDTIDPFDPAEPVYAAKRVKYTNSTHLDDVPANVLLNPVTAERSLRAIEIAGSYPSILHESLSSHKSQSTGLSHTQSSFQLSFPGLNERMNLMDSSPSRKKIMPLRFNTIDVYRETVISLILEHLQVSLVVVAVLFSRICHTGIKGKMDDRYFHDIWVLSKSASFEVTCVMRSYFYGPSANGAIELAPISSKDDRTMHAIISSDNSKCYAIRAFSASSEFPLLANLKQSLPTCPIMKEIISPQLLDHRDFNDIQKSTVLKQKGFKTPTIRRKEMLVSGHDVLYDRLLCEIIAEYHLNDDQAQVVRQFSNSISNSQKSPITLVHGVFGAGKSFLIGVIVIFLFRVKEHNLFSGGSHTRIVISSMTNVAVDLILLNLLKLGFNQFARAGSLRKIAKPLLPFTFQGRDLSDDMKELQTMLKDPSLTENDRRDVRRAMTVFKSSANKEVLSESFVIGVTCLATNFEILDNFVCPIVILDECSQMTEPMSLLPLCRFSCERALLVGDPKQLPPTVQTMSEVSITNSHGMEWTLFERLSECGIQPIMLRTQYRCHPNIADISSTLFYNSELLHGVNECDRPALVDGLPPAGFLNVPSGIEQSSFGGSIYNTIEAHHICDLVSQLVQLGIQPSDMGVITLYKAQGNLITKLLTEQGDADMLRDIQVSTVDAYQGAEKAVIILSTVRTKFKGFIDEARRINVAITRAKNHLIVVGLSSLLKSIKMWEKVLSRCAPIERDQNAPTPIG
ncbi:hypothetical protein BASA50_000344 [Batrachochytrium salamandrivorans]|uniref:DNA2/NAM7 helicase-like C-terminal domain-containing protein n=1 Tax=Batrachochytrium salamandrivorans TaxID=1357716 RepID=A0ABQ8EU27_9FUNG|nr:hypothetical protein BASA50_000344 [Batrachochytrium salamandrivorans]